MRKWRGPTGKRRERWKMASRGWKPEGEAEVPEIIFLSDAVEGTPVDLEGESRRAR